MKTKTVYIKAKQLQPLIVIAILSSKIERHISTKIRLDGGNIFALLVGTTVERCQSQVSGEC
jgi:hypothetical protein